MNEAASLIFPAFPLWTLYWSGGPLIKWFCFLIKTFRHAFMYVYWNSWKIQPRHELFVAKCTIGKTLQKILVFTLMGSDVLSMTPPRSKFIKSRAKERNKKN